MKFLFAAGYLADAEISLDLAKQSDHFYATVGVHPCRAKEPFIEGEGDEEQKLT